MRALVAHGSKRGGTAGLAENPTRARGHRTFGRRLASDATGFPASVMARTLAGDWRDPDQVERWVTEIVEKMEKLEHREVKR